MLINANRDQELVIFRDELMQLSASHPDRLAIIHWLETVQQRPPDELGFQRWPVLGSQSEIFVCGPQPFMDARVQARSSLSVLPERASISNGFCLFPMNIQRRRLPPSIATRSLVTASPSIG